MASPPSWAGLERLDHCLGVDQTATARIDQQCASFHPGQRSGIDDVMALRCQGTMQRDDVRLGDYSRDKRLPIDPASPYAPIISAVDTRIAEGSPNEVDPAVVAS